MSCDACSSPIVQLSCTIRIDISNNKKVNAGKFSENADAVRRSVGANTQQGRLARRLTSRVCATEGRKLESSAGSRRLAFNANQFGYFELHSSCKSLKLPNCIY